MTSNHVGQCLCWKMLTNSAIIASLYNNSQDSINSWILESDRNICRTLPTAHLRDTPLDLYLGDKGQSG